jgi:hypothetical protein
MQLDEEIEGLLENADHVSWSMAHAIFPSEARRPAADDIISAVMAADDPVGFWHDLRGRMARRITALAILAGSERE